MNTGILKAEGLCKSYGSKRVLEGLDLTIQPGRIYGLIGRNGRVRPPCWASSQARTPRTAGR